MPNVTISIPEHLLEKAKRYAAQRGISLSGLLRECLEELVGMDKRRLEESLHDFLELAEKHKGRLEKWKRERISMKSGYRAFFDTNVLAYARL